jgi:predicted metallopeptidase
MHSDFQVGLINVMSSDNGPLSAEQWAKLAADKIMHVGNKTEGPIRDQALAFKNNIQKVIEYYITQAVQSNERYLLSRR